MTKVPKPRSLAATINVFTFGAFGAGYVAISSSSRGFSRQGIEGIILSARTPEESERIRGVVGVIPVYYDAGFSSNVSFVAFGAGYVTISRSRRDFYRQNK